MKTMLLGLTLCLSLTCPAVAQDKKDKPDPIVTVQKYGKVSVAMAGGAGITGELVYPTPLILENLGLGNLNTTAKKRWYKLTSKFDRVDVHPDRDTFLKLRHKFVPDRLEKLRDEKVLSLGEGYSGMVPFLRNSQVDAYGLDLWYDPATKIPDEAFLGEMMKAYRKKYAKYLIAGDATNLRGLKDEDYRMVISNHLFEYLDEKQREQMTREALRVTKGGGSIHFVFYPIDDKPLENYLAFLRKEKGVTAFMVLKGRTVAEKTDEFEKSFDKKFCASCNFSLLTDLSVLAPYPVDSFEPKEFLTLTGKEPADVGRVPALDVISLVIIK